MLVRKELGYVLLIGIGLLSVVGLIGSAWLYVNLEPMYEDQKLEAEMLRIREAARLHQHRLGSYQNVCQEVGVRGQYDCNDAVDSFAASVERPDGSFYCVDSTGYFACQILPIRTYTACVR